jgi:FXSXX-COOH protein
MSYAADERTGGVDDRDARLDISTMSLREILGESALAGALGRLAQEAAHDEGSYSAFGNFAPDDEPGPAVM